MLAFVCKLTFTKLSIHASLFALSKIPGLLGGTDRTCLGKTSADPGVSNRVRQILFGIIEKTISAFCEQIKSLRPTHISPTNRK